MDETQDYEFGERIVKIYRRSSDGTHEGNVSMHGLLCCNLEKRNQDCAQREVERITRLITMRSKMMLMVALSVTEAELYAAVMTVQGMLFIIRIVGSMGLQVEKPMLLEIDKNGAKDLINNWSVEEDYDTSK
jgi:hypothetical protein